MPVHELERLYLNHGRTRAAELSCASCTQAKTGSVVSDAKTNLSLPALDRSVWTRHDSLRSAADVSGCDGALSLHLLLLAKACSWQRQGLHWSSWTHVTPWQVPLAKLRTEAVLCLNRFNQAEDRMFPQACQGTQGKQRGEPQHINFVPQN